MTKKNVKIIFILIIFSFTCFMILQNKNYLKNPPWSIAINFSYPEYAVADMKNNIFVIDNAKRRVLRINAENEVSLILNGGKRDTKSFFYAVDLAAQDTSGDFYLLNNVFDEQGFYLIREEILHYDQNGKLLGSIYQRNHDATQRDATIAQRGQIRGLDFYNDKLHWFVIDDEGIQPYYWSLESDEVYKKSFYSLPQANIKLASIRQSPFDDFIFNLKNGQIFLVKDQGDFYSTQLYYQAPQNNFSVVPWELVIDTAGRIYFIDLRNRAFQQITAIDTITPVFNHDYLTQYFPDVENFNYYRFSLNSLNQLITTNEEAVLQWSLINSKPERYLTSSIYNDQLKLIHGLTWFGFFVFIFLFFILVRHLFNFLTNYFSVTFYQAIAIIFSVSTTSIVVSFIIISNLTQHYEHIVLEKISNMLQTQPQFVDAELFEEINGMGDFYNDAYQEIRKSFMQGLNYNQDPWNRYSYFAIYRVIDHQLYGFMYLNGAIGMMHPFDWLSEDSIYKKALDGIISTEVSKDVVGEWLYGVGPIYNQRGEVVALYETGTDLYAYNLANQKLIKTIIIQVATIVIILLLIMFEIIFLYQFWQTKNKLKNRKSIKERSFSHVQLARTVNFIFFTAVSMSLAFIPLMMSSFYEPIPGLSREFLLALPISLEMFFFGVATLVAGYLVNPLGWRLLFGIGLSITFFGLIFSGLAWDMQSFCLARSVVGLGNGLAYISLRSFVNQERRIEARSKGYSHFYAGMIAGINVGVVTGAGFSDYIGFSMVFFVAAMVLLLIFPFYLHGLKDESFFNKTNASVQLESKKLSIFLSDYKIWVFFLSLVLPTYLAGTFMVYYLPIFAESQGLSTGDIGRLFILNGLFIIYLGPFLGDFLKRKMDDYTIQIIGSLLWAISLIIFALTGSILGAIIAIIIMGISEGFGVTAQNDYYLSMPTCKKIGAGPATGYYELFSKIGETLGPIGFSIALLLGQSLGIVMLALFIILATLPAVFYLKPERVYHDTSKENLPA